MNARARVLAAADGEFQLSPHVNVNKYWADVLHQGETAEHPPQWCGAFALWCLHSAGLGLDLRWLFATATDKRSGFLWALHQTVNPQPGDIVYFAHWQHHAVFRCSVGTDQFDSVDGNQGPVAPIKCCERLVKDATAFYSIATLIGDE